MLPRAEARPAVRMCRDPGLRPGGRDAGSRWALHGGLTARAWGQQNSPRHCVQTVSVLSVPHLVKNTHHQNPSPVPGEASEVIRNQTSGSSQREAREEVASGLVRTHSGHLGG